MTDRDLLDTILKRLDAMAANMATKDELDEIKANMATKNDIADIKRKLDAVYEQTAMLTEFRTEINHRLDDIANTVGYLMHKDSQTEKELFLIKKSISNK